MTTTPVIKTPDAAALVAAAVLVQWLVEQPAAPARVRCTWAKTAAEYLRSVAEFEIRRTQTGA